MIIKYNLDNRDIISGCCGDLIHIHAEASVSANIHHCLIFAAHLGSDTGSQTVAHSSQTARGQKSSWLFIFIILSRPHLVLPHICGNNGLPVCQLIDFLHDIRAGQLLLVIAQRIHIAHSVDMGNPLLMVHRIQPCIEPS